MMSEAAARRALEAIDQAARRLADAGVESPRLDAELLLAAAAGVFREAVIAGSMELSPAILNKFEAMSARRERREPMAYILGHKEFYSLDFEVSPAVLIPRPETEFVVSAALECVAGKGDARVLDIGTGSGAIAIAVAVSAPNVRVVGVDISAEALEVASRNVRRHRMEDRVTLRRADCFNMLDGGAALSLFDAIVSNPPYLDDQEIIDLDLDVYGYEPRIALTAGKDGNDVIRKIASQAPFHLVLNGELIVETGAAGALAVREIVEAAGLRVVSVINDLAGHQRVVRARKLEP
jgi:release factor glutamine methyltransferase